MIEPHSNDTRLTARRYHEAYPGSDIAAMASSMQVGAAFRAQRGAIERMFDSVGLDTTFPRYTILRILFFSKGTMVTQTELKHATGVTSPNVTYLIDGLVKENLVIRAPHPDDRRTTCVELTAAGHEVAARLVPEMAEFMGRMLLHFSDDEKETLRSLLRRLQTNAEASYPRMTTDERKSLTGPRLNLTS